MAVLFQEEVHSPLSERQKQKQTLVRYWKNSRIITSERILKAFMEIRREYFVQTSFADQAYADHPLPIGEGQTISQPTTVMLMLQLLEVEPEHRVLEIGAGCGYNAALLGLLAKEVVTIERHEKLAVLARANLRKAGISDVTVLAGDGKLGDLEHSPYNRIIVTAAAQNIPVSLKDQLLNRHNEDKGRNPRQQRRGHPARRNQTHLAPVNRFAAHRYQRESDYRANDRVRCRDRPPKT